MTVANNASRRAWERIMNSFKYNKYINSCGSEGISSFCRHCGNCLREFFATQERMREE